MPTITIDNQTVEVPEGASVLQAARKLGIDIPALCYQDGKPPNTSCMACLVKLPNGKLVPSCTTQATDGLVVESETDEVRTARRTALELLLSDHLGDCEAPCHGTCPAHMNIPLMCRQIARQEMRDAIFTVKSAIAMPATLGRICPEICERACRRGQHDQAVSICLLKRYVADVDLAGASPYKPDLADRSDKRVAIVGAGPAGLACAYYLRQAGHVSTVFDRNDKPGGALRTDVPRDQLPEDVLDAEIATLLLDGIELRLGSTVGQDVTLDQLAEDYDAVFVAVGNVEDQDSPLGLAKAGKGIQIDRKTGLTRRENVFAGGDAVQPIKQAVRAVGDGRQVAESIDALFRAGQAGQRQRPFSVHLGKLQEGEAEQFLQEATRDARVELPSKYGPGFSDDQARTEASRCLHCDCRAPESCKLRRYGAMYDARPTRFRSERKAFVQETADSRVVFEPGKCIDCGICVAITTEKGGDLGLTFIGRGFDVRVAGGFGKPVAESLASLADECVAHCPTAALAYRDAEERTR